MKLLCSDRLLSRRRRRAADCQGQHHFFSRRWTFRSCSSHRLRPQRQRQQTRCSARKHKPQRLRGKICYKTLKFVPLDTLHLHPLVPSPQINASLL
ncbi:hypothetical protein L596_009191 [Steinernema carpocapsae]|uniref:Uncharacterized protein n=1 Tax=Steinernema carpocapsae TaxID=34508 RepID=A0A4U5PF19_STECR|nr:hypothetical protein L596_009191 [Steinernema carpocapsae]